jgi:hypothetical protein
MRHCSGLTAATEEIKKTLPSLSLSLLYVLTVRSLYNKLKHFYVPKILRLVRDDVSWLPSSILTSYFLIFFREHSFCLVSQAKAFKFYGLISLLVNVLRSFQTLCKEVESW